MPKPFDLQSPGHPITRSPDQLLTYSFVIPAYNESVRIRPTLHALLRHVQEQNWDAEILVVNDGSSDDTAQIVREYGKSHPQILLVENPGNRGKGYSVRNGMLHARGDICLFTDADLSSPITEARKLFDAIGHGADIAIGSRWLRGARLRRRGRCRQTAVRRPRTTSLRHPEATAKTTATAKATAADRSVRATLHRLRGGSTGCVCGQAHEFGNLRSHCHGGDGALAGARQVAGAEASHQGGDDAGLHALRFFGQMKGVAQHQGDREDGAERIGDVLAGDVGSRSMDGFVETDRASDAGGGEQAERSHDPANLIGEDVAEHVFGEDDVELGRPEDERHGSRVHVHVGELDIGEIAGDASDDLAPETRTLQNIRLVDGEQAPAAGASELKGNAGDALDLRLTIPHGVERLARAGFACDGARLAEIQSPEQFAHDENVSSFHDFFAQRRAGGERRIKDRGTEIGERSELLAEAQQAGFGAKLARIVIEGGTADGSEQYGL